MGGPPREVLVGRTQELSQLRRSLEAARRGRGAVVLVGGEPGIGKTRLARELATIAYGRGVEAFWGRCIEAGAAPPYWPWAQVVRSMTSAWPLSAVREVLGDAGSLSALFPQVPPSGAPRKTTAHLGADRFRLFQAVHTVLHRACRQSAVLLIVEDVHWADRNSLLLLEFIAQPLSTLPILLVATYRDTRVPDPLAQTLGELARLGTRRLSLTGMTLEETARLMRAASGRASSSAMVRAVHARTSGNPFFVTEIARLPRANANLVPENVRDAIAKRLAPLSRLGRRVLMIAAVMGREFDLAVVAAVLPDPYGDGVLRALDEALDARLLEPLERRGSDWYQFTHELIREALYDSASPSRRVRWHAGIVRALEQTHAARLSEYAAELATHAARAQPVLGDEAVVKYARMAGEQKLATHAFEEALPHFEHAWHSCATRPIDAEAAAILLGLGCAQAATAVRWNREEGWATLRKSIEYYLQTGETGRAVSAAVHPSIAAEGVSNVSLVVERILPRVSPGSPEEGWLSARLGAALYFETGSHGRARAAFDRALRIASSQREPALELRTLAYETSVDHFDLRWPDVLTKSRRVLALARRVDDLYSETYARYRAAFVLTHLGRADDARLEIEANLAAAERLRDRGLLADALYVAATLAHLAGAWTEARAHIDRGLALAPQHLPLLHGRVLLEYETGREREGEGYLERLLQADGSGGPYPLAGVFTAIILAQIARLSSSTPEPDAGIAAVRRVLVRPAAIPNAVVTARMARALWGIRQPHLADCEDELESLEPLLSLMPTQWGLTLARLLGALAHAAGRPRSAVAHFETALAFCRGSDFKPELAWTCFDYAGCLLDTGDIQDRLKARTLIEHAEQLAATLGMRPLAGHLATFRERYRLKLDSRPAGLTMRELEILRLLAGGKSNKEIAQALSISVNTVAVHVAHVLAKTGAANRTEAAAHALRHHLL